MSKRNNQEKEVRMAAFQDLMDRKELQGVIAVGNGCVGTNAYGCFRYLTDIRVNYHIYAAVFFRDKAPVGIFPDKSAALDARNGFLDDLVVSPEPVQEIIRLLQEAHLEKARIGTFLDILPQSWYRKLRAAFPEMELMDIAEDVFLIRNHHSDGEIAKLLHCGRIADAGYKAVLDTVHPGMTEQQLAAEIEYETQMMGAEENFTLVSVGRFSLEDNKLLPIRAGTMLNKTICAGDSIAMEITPRYQGYWTQLVRTVSVGAENPDLEKMHGVVADVIQKTLPELRPGNRIGNIAKTIRTLTEAGGYRFSLPCGHICGLDLNEERLTEDNNRLLEPGMTVILHPSITTPTIGNGIFWGETYLITENGCRCLMESDQSLKTVNHQEVSYAVS